MKTYCRNTWIIVCGIVLVWMTCIPVSCKAEEPDNLYAQSAVLMDADSGRILFEKDGDSQKANASTTKILTCILALEYGNMQDLVEISENAEKQPEVRLGVKKGEQYRLEDLLYSMMLESHNDSAVAIAEHIGGNVSEFARLMNQKAREIGCRQTHFVTPNGLDQEDATGAHNTTAVDLCIIMRYCVKQSPQREAFCKITGTANYKFSEESHGRQFQCVNHNQLLHTMAGAYSGKTGFTTKAGYCYVGAVEEGGRSFVLALLACGWPGHKSYKWVDAGKLIDYGMHQYERKPWFDFQDIKEPLQVAVGRHCVKGECQKQGDDKENVLAASTERCWIDYQVTKEIAENRNERTIVGLKIYRIENQTVKIDPISIEK